ncbi:EFMT2 methyltransferase, partial [Atractosteus spatula]|nr:EFMT2 methyltransferase [Atractosteus spatula]
SSDFMDSTGCAHGLESGEDACDFTPSKLGTKEYWDDAYTRELQNFKDIGDVGEIWFGEESMERVIKWLKKEKIPHNAAVLDIGTGNGVFLVELAKCGFKNLTGIDYSAVSVDLARHILEKEGLSDVKVQEQDFLYPSALLGTFDVCVDKGTFDAISLNPDSTAQGTTRYVQALRSVLRQEGLFLITSCNWTREQLLHVFSEGFELLQELPTPQFQFGGRSGSSVTALVLKRKD